MQRRARATPIRQDRPLIFSWPSGKIRVKLTQLDPIQIKRVQYQSDLAITNCRYSAVCSCGKTSFYPSDEIMLDREVGGKHWVSIYFQCKDCDEEWEEEFQIEVKITVNVVTDTEKPNE